jgi:hypothetical protein
MDYERKDSIAKAKSGKEPQKLEHSMKAPKGYKNTLDEQEAKRDSRREMLNKQFNKVVKDPF